ncbi:MAG: hypothetical protein IPL61_06600 [Myxococcales bacterium]|nr:hypothetical protein [Myxococcales bacterium]
MARLARIRRPGVRVGVRLAAGRRGVWRHDHRATPGHAEVEHAHRPSQAIMTLPGPVAVDDAGGVGGAQPGACGGEHRHDLAPAARRASPFGEGLTVDQLHGDEDALGEAAGVVDRAQVRCDTRAMALASAINRSRPLRR